MRILIVTDAWAPQINGVVRTLEALVADLGALGHDVRLVTPQGRFSLPLPTYPEIRLALFQHHDLTREITSFAPDAVHIATEGALGMAARRICLQRDIGFSTAFHTRFAEYVHARFPLAPENLVWRFLRWFHRPALAVMAATPGLARDLQAHGLRNVVLWPRGVDVNLFHPREGVRPPWPAPVWLNVGRVAVEKNIEAFLALNLPGTKIVVGDGPDRDALARRHPDVHFPGSRTREDLARIYAGADVFVFPSRTDTFGLVLLEALASGLTVAAFPVEGPADVLGGPEGASVAALDEDLGKACLRALALKNAHEGNGGGGAPRAFAMARSWRACTQAFLDNLQGPRRAG